jgi:hypothetical protein
MPKHFAAALVLMAVLLPLSFYVAPMAEQVLCFFVILACIGWYEIALTILKAR